MENEKPPKSLWWGPFYSAPNDIRLTVPRRDGYGWTINFGHRFVRIIAGIIILLSILIGRFTNH